MIRVSIIIALLSLSLAGCRSARIAKTDLRASQTYTPQIPDSSVASQLENSDRAIDDQDGNQDPNSKRLFRKHRIRRVSAESNDIDDLSAAQTEDETFGLSLQDCISTAVAQNPDLITLRQSEQVGRAAMGVANTYPFNPFVQVQATPYQHSQIGNSGSTYHYVLLMQTIQLAHQQQFREQGASFSLNSTRWNIHQAELTTLSQTARLFFGGLYTRGLMELADASHANNIQLLEILEKQLEAGQTTASDVAIVRVDAGSTKQQLQLAMANYQTALRDLSRQTAISIDQLPGLKGDLRAINWRFPGTTARASGTTDELAVSANAARSSVLTWSSSRPDVMAAKSDIDVARAARCLATAAKTPDLQIGPYYQTTADGTNFVGFRGQVDIPVINDGTPLERQRTAEHHQRIVAWQQIQRRAELEASAAFDRYEQALSAIAAAEKETVEDFPSELAGLEAQFLAGEVDVVRVVQARTSLVQNQRVHLDLLNELGQAAADLIGATGIPVDQICTTSF